MKENQDELVLDEFNRWSKLYINIEVLTNDFEYKCKEVSALKGRIAQLEAEMRVSGLIFIKFLLSKSVD